MIEWIPLVLLGGGLLPGLTKKSELKKIEEIFENVGFCVKHEGGEMYPDFLEKKDTDTHRRYTFRLPLGLTIEEKLADKIAQSLNRSVEINGDSEMHIFIYKQKLPSKWDYCELPNVEGWQVPIGKSFKGMVWHDFDKIPHMTKAGTTRFGKTVSLKVMMTYLIEHHPNDVEIYIIDLKGGLEFYRYRDLKQVKSVASDLFEAQVTLGKVKEAIQQDMEYFKSQNYTNVVNAPVQSRKFIIIDEAAELTPDKEPKEIKAIKHECVMALSNVARVAGALGYRLIYCTQYPTADTMPRQIKQNADGKLSFRLPTGYASQVAIDEYGAERLEFPGRAIYKTHERVTVQVPFISDGQMWQRLRGFERDPIDDEISTVESDVIEFG